MVWKVKSIRELDQSHLADFLSASNGLTLIHESGRPSIEPKK